MWFCLPDTYLSCGTVEFLKVSIIGFLVFVRKLMFLKYNCQKTLKKNCGRPVFLEELQAATNFSKVCLHFNKISNSLRHILQAYSEICIFLCGKKLSSRSSRQRLISKCQGNPVIKSDDDVMKFIL